MSRPVDFRAHTHSSAKIVLLWRLCYMNLLLWSFEMANSVKSVELQGDLFPWILRWAKWFDSNSLFIALSLSPVLILPACLAPQLRWPRILAAVGYIFSGGLSISGGNDSHQMVAGFWIALVLAAAPDFREALLSISRAARHRLLHWHTAIVAISLLPYVASGLWKLYTLALAQPLKGERGLFDLQAFSKIVAGYQVKTSQSAALAPFIVDHHMVGWFSLIGAILLQAGAWVPLFKTRLLPYWGLGIILFHIMSGALLNITFRPQIIFAFVLLVLWPMGPFMKWREN